MYKYFIEDKTTFDKVMDVLVFGAVFVVTIFLIADIIGASPRSDLDRVKFDLFYLFVNVIVFFIFAVDLYRLARKSKNWKEFFKGNWLDILATIPFGVIAYYLGNIDPRNSSFAILKWIRIGKLTGVARLQRISKISKISKQFKAAAHMKRQAEEMKRKNKL